MRLLRILVVVTAVLAVNAHAQSESPIAGRWGRDGRTLLDLEANAAGAVTGNAFTPSADGNRLHYTIVMTDPHSLTQPVEQKRSWVAVDEQVLPYNCTPPRKLSTVIGR